LRGRLKKGEADIARRGGGKLHELERKAQKGMCPGSSGGGDLHARILDGRKRVRGRKKRFCRAHSSKKERGVNPIEGRGEGPYNWKKSASKARIAKKKETAMPA